MKATLRRRFRASRGQAAVEAALVLPLVCFLIMGILQLSLIQQARALTQYAIFNAVRAGAVGYGDCTRMMHAAYATLIPAIEPFTAGSPGAPGAGLAAAFGRRFTAPATFQYTGTALDDLATEDVLWIRREQPLMADVALNTIPSGQYTEWDDPDALPLQAQFRLEAEVVFWYPMKIPFANWIIARLIAAQWGLIAFTERNPIVNNGQMVDWSDDARAPPFDGLVAGELVTRITARHYHFPIRANYTMRMMTPVKRRFFLKQNCDPMP